MKKLNILAIFLSGVLACFLFLQALPLSFSQSSPKATPVPTQIKNPPCPPCPSREHPYCCE